VKDAFLDESKGKAMSLSKDLLRKQLQERYCEAGGNQATCNANVEALVDIIYETAMYIIELQKSSPSRPVPVSVIIEFTTRQMLTIGKWGGSDVVACAAATTLFGFSIVKLTPSIAINSVIATSAATSGLGIPLALGAGAFALGGAALLLWEGYGTYDTCSMLWRPPAAPSSTLENRRQAERYLWLLQHQMSTQPNSCSMSRGF
jgi:hypothetical protein